MVTTPAGKQLWHIVTTVPRPDAWIRVFILRNGSKVDKPEFYTMLIL